MNGKSPLKGIPSSVDLYITHLDHVGPYLKIYGQASRDAARLVIQRIEKLALACFAIDQSWSIERQQVLLIPGTTCIIKRQNGAAPGDVEYMRTRILSADIDDNKHSDVPNQMRVEIEFLDYGYKRNVSSHDLLFLKQPKLLQNFPLLCSQYIVLGICSEWNQSELDTVNQLLVHELVNIEVDPEQICDQKFGSVRWKDFKLNEFLVQQKQIGAPIANELMMEHCKKLWKASPQSPTVEYNNNSVQSTGGSPKSPTEVAREHFAARFSVAARLDMQRSLPPVASLTPPRPLNTAANEYTPPKQPQQQQQVVQPMPTPLANLTNVLPAAHLAQNAQKSAFVAANHLAYNNTQRANYQTSEPSSGLLPTHNVYTPKTSPRPLNMYYNVRLNNPMQPQQPQMPLMQLPKQPALNYAPAPRYALTQPSIAAAAQLQQQQQQALQPIIPAFRTSSLTVGLTYDVYVSYVENGPYLFWVQLKTAENDLNAMMSQIEHIRLQTLNQFPGVGTACVARFSEDGNCYRALVSAVYGQRYRVVYVDYGNSEMVSLTDLYQIPPELLQIKPFAFRFALAGAKELGALDESMKRIFKNSALYINFQLTVQAAESVGSMQTCQLMHNGNSMLEVLKKLKNSRQAYAKAEHLQNDDIVEIRYIDSPSNFYVQKVNNVKQFEQLMDEMFAYYNINQKVPDQLILGAPCVVKCDREWYRAELLRVDDSTIIVRHVDFGYEQHVKRHLIGIIAEKHLVMPRQAIKCCLKGFENSEMSLEKITDQFEMLAEESNIRRRSFSVRVFRIEPDGLNVVNLLAKNLNVMKKLYKLSMPFEQYLSLEKGQFNANVTRAESTASDAVPMQLEKGQVLNSTTVESEDRMQMQKQRKNATNSSNDWDKHSSASASSKDTQSQQSGAKRQQQQQLQQQQLQRPERNGTDGNLVRRSRDARLDSSFESQSTSSYTSGMGSPRKGNRQNGRNRTDSPRLQNGNKQEVTKNTRFANTPSPRKDQAQQQQQQQSRGNQRSQNAPQGFAQKPQRQKSTLDGSSKRSSGVESDATSSNTESSPKSMPQPEKYLPLDKTFVVQDIKMPTKEATSLSWWVSPFQFYVVPKSLASKYESLLREMRQFYRQKPHQPLQLKVGSSVVVRQRKDNSIMRGTVVACNHMVRKYRIFCVDAGNLLTVSSEDVWQLEQRFAEPPCLALRCSFDGVVTNYDHLYIVDRMEKFVPANAKVECEFKSKQNNNTSSTTYIVKMLVNGASLRDTLINAQFLTEVAEQVRVNLLAGQQVRGKFTSIRDMTNFKIQLESCSDVNFLCSYDDTKFVKSNQDVAKRFKEHYEGRSYALNIKHVCENNIIHLRPVMPLFKEERSAFICGYPVLVNSFNALVVYTAKSYRIFVQPSDVEKSMKQLLDDMFEFYSKKGKQLRKIEKDQICAALSADGNWYRARILAKDGKGARLDVLYIDYGNSEQLAREQLKQLEEKFYVNKSCYAVEVNLPFGRIHNDEKLKARLASLLEEQVVTVKPIETRRNHLIADVLLHNGKDSVLDTLKAEKLIAGKDIDYMRKQLDKEKPHVYEYIECVDLTIDDDDEQQQQRKFKSSSSSASSSPKKKPQQEPKESKRNKQPEPVSPVVAVEPVVAAIPTPPKAEIIKPVEPVPIEIVPEPQPTPEIEASAAPEDSPIPTPTAVAAVTPPPDPYEHMEKARLSHCDNPAQFYVHTMDALPKLQRLTENLMIVSPSLPQLTDIVNGAECISMYSMDKCWYRAKILDAELMVLQFIDYGNTDCVSDAREIKQSMGTQTEPLCLPFALPIAPKGTVEWPDAANSIFNDSFDKLLHFEYLTQGDCQTRSYVNLYIEGVDVAKKLIEDGFAKPLEYVSSGSSCYISHSNSISDFYVQLESDSKALELIELYLGDAEQQLQPLECFEKGSIVAALFDDDGLFYRAELLRQLPDSRYEVRFIDYGNTSTTAKCLLLTEQIASVPCLSKRCSLQLPEDYLDWSDQAELKFAELTGEGELVFTTQLLQPGLEHILIHLLLDDVNVLDKLLPLCTQKQRKLEVVETPVAPAATTNESSTELAVITAIVTHVNTPTSFYLQFESCSQLVDSISEQLNSANANPRIKENIAQLGDLCVAQFVDDMEFYRARVVEHVPSIDGLQYRVLFIDYGNQALVNKLFELPAKIAKIKPLAELHALESCANFLKYPKESREALDALIDSCNGEVVVEFLNKSAKPPIVRLKTMDKHALNIHEQLQKLLKPALEKNCKHNECIISHGNSPKNFYVQLKKNSANLDLIVKLLQDLKIEELPEVTYPNINVLGICYAPDDDCYYRCCIREVMPEGCEVFLSDHGGTLVTKKLYSLPDELLQVPLQTPLHCKLNQIPQDVSDDKLEEAFAALLEKHFGEVYELVGDFQQDAKTQQVVQLRVNYKDFAEELASTLAGVQQPLEVVLHNCFVVQYDNAKSFYVQMEDDVPALEQMTDKMLDADKNFEPFTELAVGALCVAKFPEDEVFYRAVITKLLDDGKCEVHFIDFGNNTITDEFRQLPEDLAKAPGYSKHCELESATIAKCDVAALGAFIDARFSESFQLEILTKKDDSDTNVVRLFYQNSNITEQLRLQKQS